MKIVLFGPPGSGKGTQAKFIEEDLGVPHISTGDIFRRELQMSGPYGARGRMEEMPLGLQAKRYMDAGELVPDQLVVVMVQERLKGDDVTKGFILDGFPRTVPQARALDTITDVDVVLNIQVEDEVLVERLTSRRSCKDCGYVYNLMFQPPATEGKCDKCGGDLIQRGDDKEDTVRNRLQVYKDQSLPVEDFYSDKGILRNVDGTGDIKVIRERVKEALK